MVNKRMLIEVSVSAASGIAIGYGVGVFVTQRRMKAEIDRILNEEIARMAADMEDISHRINKTGPYATPEEAADHLIAQTDELIEKPERGTFGQYITETQDEPEEVVKTNLKYVAKETVESNVTDIKEHFKDAQVTDDGQVLSRPEKSRESFIEQNVFEEYGDDEDGEVLDLDDSEKIDPSKPYVISLEDFQTTRDDQHKAVVIYYAGDDTLTDEADTLIDDIDGNVGRENLERFGHGSGAANTVYIRNEKNGVDYEMVRIKRGWAEEKFGIDPDPKTKPRVRRMRGDDE